MADFLELLQERVMVYDGAMGTSIQNYNLTVDRDYEGLENCSEILVVSRPDVIREIHASYLQAGADVIETDSFGASSLVLAEFGIAGRARELNLAAAKLARTVADEFSTPEKPRFVAGSIGPTTKLPSLGHIGYDAMAATYREQMEALIEGGCDILLIETCQDLLQAKIALAAAADSMKALGVVVPVQMQVTLEATGTMLLGSEIGAALAVLECFRPDVIGLNCATGPKEMNDAVRFLCQNATMPVSVLPNAGLPQNEGGRAVYKLQPKELAEYQRRFVTEYGVQVVGGCCGTTPAHIRAVAEAMQGLKPKVRDVKPQSIVSSAFSTVTLEVDGQPAIIAEEMNTTTRAAGFRDMVRGGDYDGIFTMAKRLVNEGSQMLDLCCAVVGEDEIAYMNAVLEKIATRVTAPMVVDSTEAEVIEEALKRIPGKPIINSINLEDGEKRTSKVLPMARRYGAAVIALTIDEDGMALTADKKVAIAHRIHKLATETYGMRSEDLIFDALTLPISTGQEDYRSAGMETLEAVRRIKLELPKCRTTLGVSNISFGLNAYARRVLNSVFLKEAVDRGLDSAIVNYAKIYPLYKIPEQEVELARKLIFREVDSEQDPLQIYMQYMTGLTKTAGEEEEAADTDSMNDEEKLKFLIINGERSVGQNEKKQTLPEILESALTRYTPLDLINTVLLDGMKTVGELFGARKMQLPSVLDSAATMKAAVAYLEPKMEKAEGNQKGTIVLATVKGDVHDIGKNLVDIILSNNGYKVVNLGIKIPSAEIIKAAQEHKADAIGLSGLLVKSTLEMKYVVQDLEQNELRIPVICGGAALTRKYVEDDLRRETKSAVFYAEDAFAGLHVMSDLTDASREVREKRITDGSTVKTFTRAMAAETSTQEPVSTTRSKIIEDVKDIPVPPFWGPRVTKGYDLDLLFGFINETALFKNQWQLKTASATDYVRIVEEKYRPILAELCAEVKANGWFDPKTVHGYYPAQASGNDVIVYDPAGYDPTQPGSKPGGELLRITFPRQREGRMLSIADFFAPVESGRMDVIGFSVVTMGARASEVTKELFDAGDFTRYLYLHGLSVETAEALAEYMHVVIRRELGIGGEDAPRTSDLFHQKYRGSRYSFGYPACPNLEDQTKIFKLLKPEESIGVRLTEGWHIEPEQSTDAVIVHHPQAKYFVV
ncbi:MAG: methionine synthase [Acidobacteria bacterium]|nr:methionine synthase [Acidobacteriota bacterium]